MSLADQTLSTQSAQVPHTSLSPFNLTGIVLLVMFAAIALAYTIESAKISPELPVQSQMQAPFVDQNIAGAQLHVPSTWLRSNDASVGEFADQIELQLLVQFPNVSAPQPIEILLVPRSQALNSSYLLDRVYLHQFSNEQIRGVPGLVGKTLNNTDGYQHETVWYDPLSARPFVAKCMAQVAPNEPTNCLRTVSLTEGLSATFSFDQSLLIHWREFDSAIGPLLDQIGAL